MYHLTPLKQLVDEGQNIAVGRPFNSPATLHEGEREAVELQEPVGNVRYRRKRKNGTILVWSGYGMAIWMGVETKRDYVCTSYDELGHGVRMSERIKPYGTLVSGDASYPTHG